MSNYKVVGEQAVPDWDNEEAATIFQQLYTAADGKVDGVLAANDGLGGAAITILEGNGQAGKVPVTGQDATVEGLQNVLAGTQCMTVYKSATQEAGALADAAIALVNGEEAETTGTTDDASEGGRDVPSILLSRSPSPRTTSATSSTTAARRPRTCAPASSPTCAPRPASPDRLTPHRGTAPGPHRGPGVAPVVSHNKFCSIGSRTHGQPLLELRGVNKSFGVVHVLHDVDFAVYPGQVTALVGDNGAGKSTLVKIIAGIYGRDSGDYLFEGQPVDVHGPRDVAALGIEVVYQDLALCDNLDIVENMFLGREETTRFGLDEVTMETRARETLASLSVRTVKSVRQSVASLSGGQRQTVAIAKAVLWNSKVVLLDEPTAALGVAQTRQVLDLVRRLADRGLGVVLISHNMGDVLRGRRPDHRALPRPGGRRRPGEGRHPQPDRRAHHRRTLRRPRHRREPRDRDRLRRTGDPS